MGERKKGAAGRAGAGMVEGPRRAGSLITLAGLPVAVEEEWLEGRVVRLRLRLPGPAEPARAPTLPTPVALELVEMAEGRRRAPSFPFRLRGTPFQQRVWRETASIPRGETATYGELARRLGCPSPRAVGQALKANPLPLIIPCHRVVARDGPGGYSCGLRLKTHLLRLEGSWP